MLEMNGRMDEWAREHADNPVIQVLGQQHIIDMLSNGDALRELESIEKYVYSRMQKNEIRGFLDMTVRFSHWGTFTASAKSEAAKPLQSGPEGYRDNAAVGRGSQKALKIPLPTILIRTILY